MRIEQGVLKVKSWSYRKPCLNLKFGILVANKNIHIELLQGRKECAVEFENCHRGNCEHSTYIWLFGTTIEQSRCSSLTR